jgi:hypothetical protein
MENARGDRPQIMKQSKFAQVLLVLRYIYLILVVTDSLVYHLHVGKYLLNQ